MKGRDLDFERPAELQAAAPAELRGADRDGVRLLVTTRRGHQHASFRDLPDFLEEGTVLVVNRSGTLPASLPAAGRPGDFRLNLSTHYGGGLWLAEPRWSPAEPGPVGLEPAERFDVAGLEAKAISPYPGLPRLWFVALRGDVAAAMNRRGTPIRYAYVAEPYPPLAAYQTLFAGTPGSAEMPSAARPFTERVVADLRRRGIRIAEITLHTGVSSQEVETEELEDQALYAEPFEVPAATAEAVNAARREGKPVIAVGTTVVRALESAWAGCALRPAAGFTRLFITPGKPVRSVDGLITGLHDPMASHLAMLFAVADPEQVRSAYAEAVREGYLWHEFGDNHLILPRAA